MFANHACLVFVLQALLVEDVCIPLLLKSELYGKYYTYIYTCIHMRVYIFR